MARPFPVRFAPSLVQLEDRLAPAIFAVTTNADAGAGSLRQALLSANAAPGADSIEFNIPAAGVQTINLASALPAITGTVAIKGQTQPGFVASPLIELNGLGAGAVRARRCREQFGRGNSHPRAHHQPLRRQRHQD